MTPLSLLRFMAGACGAGLLLACGGGSDAPPVAPPPPPPPGPSAIAIAPATLGFEATGSTGTLVATLAPAGATGTISWRSANAAIATVSGSGNTALVTAIAPGTTQIIAAVGSIEGSATVTVPAVPQEIEETVPATGGTITLDVSGHPFEGLELTIPAGSFDGTTTWRVSTDTTPARSFPRGATVVGPGLAIEGVSGRTSGGRMLTMRVPVAAQTDATVVIVLVDPVTGDFDLLPLMDRDSASVTVMTRHLDARLFQTSAPASPRRDAVSTSEFSWQQTPGPPSVLYRVQLPPEALRSIAATLDPARHAWPVAEDGSAQFPRGHGSAISALQVAASVLDYDLRTLVRQRGNGWFYADTAPLATVMLTAVMQQQHEAALNAIRQIRPRAISPSGVAAQFAPLPKAARDTLMATNIAAGMALTGRPQVFLKLSAGADIQDRSQQSWGTAVSTDANGNFSFLNPTANQLGSLFTLTLGANGFADVESKSLASDAAPTVRDEIVAVPAALMDISAAQSMLATMARAMQAEASERQARNHAMWQETNSRVLEVQARRTSAADFATLDGPLTVFDTAASIRLAGSEPANVVMRFYDAGSGAEALSASGTETVSIERLPGVQSASEGETVTVEGVIVDAAGRQVVPVHFDVTRGSFRLEQDTVELRNDSSVELTAVLSPPPTEGFRVHWDWGDGTNEHIAGLTSATHQYVESGDYTVVATLRRPSDTAALAVDTAEVIEAPGAWIGWVSGRQVSEYQGGITHFEATNVRWEYDSTFQTAPGWRIYRVVSGQLSYWREVACASWVGPTLRADLATGSFPTNYLLVSKSSEQVPGGGAAARWYYGQSYNQSAPRVTSKLCATTSQPDPPEYNYGGPPIFFQTHVVSTFQPQPTANRNVLEGSFTQSKGGLTSTWTWRFERVP